MKSDPLANTLCDRPPDDSAHEEILVQALQEYQSAIEAGRPIQRAALLKKYPQVGDELARCLDGMDLLGCAASALGSDGGDERPQVPVETLGDFRIVREVGRGGMGVVYEAQQLSLGRRVALKALPFASILDERMLQRFKLEAQAAASLHHDHIVPVFGVGCERGIHYYAMQFVDGYTLAELLPPMEKSAAAATAAPRNNDRNGSEHPSPGTAAETVRDAAADMSTQRSTSPNDFYRRIALLGIDAAEALHYAHQQGVLHRDIKPANLMLDATGKIWITDFGLAQFKDRDGLTMTGELVGTLRYMSPEQVSSKKSFLDERTDVYSLGATLFELMAGRPLYDEENRAELVQQIASGASSGLSRGTVSLPAELQTILAKATERDPADRYQTARELAEDLRCFVQHRPIAAKPPGARVKIRKWVQRNPQLAMVLSMAIAAIAIVAVGAVLVSQSAYRRERDQRTIAQEALEEIRKKNEALEEAQKQAAQSLAVTVEAIDQMYERFADVVLFNTPGQQEYVDEFRQKATQMYESLLEAFPTNYDIRMRAADSISTEALRLKDTTDQGVSKEAKEAQYQKTIARALALAEESRRHLKLNAKRAYFLTTIRGRNAEIMLSEYGASSRKAAEAIAATEESLTILADCVENEPEYEWGLHDLSEMQHFLAFLTDRYEGSSGQSARAKQYALQAADSAKRWLEKDPQDQHRAFARARYLQLATVFEPSLRAEALKVTEEHYLKHPSTASRNLVIHALDALSNDRPNEEAAELLDRARELSKLSAAEHPTTAAYAQNVVWINNNLSKLYLKLGRLQDAAESIKDGLHSANQLVERFATVEYKNNLAAQRHVYAAILCLMDDLAGAQSVIDEAAAADKLWCEQNEGATPKTRAEHYQATADMLLYMARFVPANDKLLAGVLTLLEQAPPDDQRTQVIRAGCCRIRGDIHVREGDWYNAALEYERYVRSNPKATSNEWMQAATLYAFAVSEGTSDLESYRRFCQSMVDRFASPDHLHTLDHKIKSCNIVAGGVPVNRADVEQLVAALDDESTDERYVGWFQISLALDAYRRGQFAAAVELAEKGYANASQDSAHVLGKAVSSLALAASGLSDQAVRALDLAKDGIEKRIKRDANGSIRGDSLFGPSVEFDHDLLIAEILTREATALLTGKAALAR